MHYLKIGYSLFTKVSYIQDTLTNRENNEKDDIEDKFSDGSPHKDLLVLRN